MNLFPRFGIRTYNYSFFGHYELQHFAVYTRDASSAIIAGVCGFILAKHQTMRLELVWVEEKCRGRGLGTKLFTTLESYAKAKNCRTIQVSTIDFQGLPFYEKMGYQLLGTIPKWFCNRDEHYMHKVL